MRHVLSACLALLLVSVFFGCSGNAIIEPVEQTSKRAKAFLAKCQAPLPPDGTELKMVYACLPAEDACPDKGDKGTAAELGYLLDRSAGCGNGTTVVDVPCGSELNAFDCCYAVRLETTSGSACL